MFSLAVEDLFPVQQQSAEPPSREQVDQLLVELGDGEWTYSRVLETLAPDPATRRDYLAKLLRAPGAGRAHELLAGLAADGLARVFATTNFDRLLEHVLQARGIEPVVVTDEVSLASAVPREHAACYVPSRTATQLRGV